ncbi:hypothetical protein [Listeria aquatica]|nr:hypothetical protein [Listeria aquatica]
MNRLKKRMALLVVGTTVLIGTTFAPLVSYAAETTNAPTQE